MGIESEGRIMITSNNIDALYLKILNDIINNGKKVGNTYELTNYCLELTDINNNIVSIRNISDTYLFAELIWYFTGSEDVRFIGEFASKWYDITDDGITSNSAYGACIRYRHGFNQLEKIIELLKKDPDSRRAVINLNVPNEFVIETKDELCTIALQFMIREGKLDCTAMMRSNDVWFGFPYDVVFFTELQRYIAMRLKIECGIYTHFGVSLHVYEDQIKKIQKIVHDYESGKLKYKYIDFDRNNFYNHYENISDEIQVAIIDDADPKQVLLESLKKYNIYERKDGNEN